MKSIDDDILQYQIISQDLIIYVRITKNTQSISNKCTLSFNKW